MTPPELLDETTQQLRDDATHRLRERILALPIGDRWYLVRALLNSIQAETTGSNGETNGASAMAESGALLQQLRNSSEAAAVLAQALTDSNGEKNELSSAQSSSAPEQEIKAPKPGLNRGAMVMSADFDDPLPDSFWGL